jgi:hypothetical protein
VARDRTHAVAVVRQRREQRRAIGRRRAIDGGGGDRRRDRADREGAGYNADGKTDLVISTRSGSYWYFSVGNGTWTVPYTRNDLPI